MKIIRVNHENFATWSGQIERLFNWSVRINFPDSNPGDSYGADKCKDVAAYLEAGSAIVFAAVEKENLLGWIWCHPIQRMDKKRLHIAEIAVSEDSLRQGVGRKLLAEAETYAAGHGYQEIDLLVTASNIQAVRFYENACFAPERYLMKKNVTASPNA